MNERLGIVEQREADRKKYARWLNPRKWEEQQSRPESVKTEAVGQVKDLSPTARRKIAPTPYTPQQIINAVSEAFKVPAGSMLNTSHSRRFTGPRHAAALLMREKMEMSYERIAHCLNRPKGCNGWDAVDRAKELRDRDPRWTRCYRAAEQLLSQS